MGSGGRGIPRDLGWGRIWRRVGRARRLSYPHPMFLHPTCEPAVRITAPCRTRVRKPYPRAPPPVPISIADYSDISVSACPHPRGLRLTSASTLRFWRFIKVVFLKWFFSPGWPWPQPIPYASILPRPSPQEQENMLIYGHSNAKFC